MLGRKSVIGIAMLCAFAFSAYAAATATAEQRAYTCSAAGTKEFNDEHCLVKGGGSPTRGHILLAAKTEITVTNTKTASSTSASDPSFLEGTLAGVITKIECPTVHGSGSLTNAASSVTGELALFYTGCIVVKPAGRGCIVKETGVTAEGVIATELLKATTVGQAASKVKIQPSSGTTLAKVPIEGCAENVPPKATYLVTGSLTATASGATTNTTEAGVTTENTLKFGGNKAGLGGSLTISQTGGDPIVLT